MSINNIFNIHTEQGVLKLKRKTWYFFVSNVLIYDITLDLKKNF